MIPVEYGPPIAITTPALNSWGTYLISVDAVKLDYPRPQVKAGMDLLLFLAIGAAVAIVMVVVLVIRKPWKA
jgi:hypothetical protein